MDEIWRKDSGSGEASELYALYRQACERGAVYPNCFSDYSESDPHEANLGILRKTLT